MTVNKSLIQAAGAILKRHIKKMKVKSSLTKKRRKKHKGTRKNYKQSGGDKNTLIIISSSICLAIMTFLLCGYRDDLKIDGVLSIADLILKAIPGTETPDATAMMKFLQQVGLFLGTLKGGNFGPTGPSPAQAERAFLLGHGCPSLTGMILTDDPDGLCGKRAHQLGYAGLVFLISICLQGIYAARATVEPTDVHVSLPRALAATDAAPTTLAATDAAPTTLAATDATDTTLAATEAKVANLMAAAAKEDSLWNLKASLHFPDNFPQDLQQLLFNQLIHDTGIAFSKTVGDIKKIADMLANQKREGPLLPVRGSEGLNEASDLMQDVLAGDVAVKSLKPMQLRQILQRKVRLQPGLLTTLGPLGTAPLPSTGQKLLTDGKPGGRRRITQKKRKKRQKKHSHKRSR